ncbi:MAG: MarR family transcriptional regulator [Clostridia bacterium]
MFIHRHAIRQVRELMAMHPLVLVDGPPRCGKSTLARQLSASSSAGAILARAGSPDGRRIIANPQRLSSAQPVILDGATMDEASILASILALPSPDNTTARLPRFVLIGGPFRQFHTPEARSGRSHPDAARSDTVRFDAVNPTIAHPILGQLSLGPLTLAEVGRGSVRAHWLRGGYPEAYTADSDSAAMTTLGGLIAGMSGGLLSPWGLPASPTRLATLLTCLAETERASVNENNLARILGISRPTICRWMDSLEQAGILHRIPRIRGKGGVRRTVQAPAWFLRDSGLIHGLLGIRSNADLRSMPRLAAASWRAYVLEQTASVIGRGTELGSYLSADGACIELVLTKGNRILAAVTRAHLPGSPGKGANLAAQAVGASDRRIVVPDETSRNMGGGFKATGLATFLDEIRTIFG